MTGSPEDRVSSLESRVAKIEQLLLNFAAMTVGSPGELERVAATIEHRRVQEMVSPSVTIDADQRTKAVQKIGRLLIGKGRVAHSDIMRAVQGIMDARQLHALMSDLASNGEVKIIKASPDRGKPTTFYEHIAHTAQIT